MFTITIITKLCLRRVTIQFIHLYFVIPRIMLTAIIKLNIVQFINV